MFIHEIETHHQSDIFTCVVSREFSGDVDLLDYYGLYTLFPWVNEGPFVDELLTLLVIRHGPMATIGWSSEFLRGVYLAYGVHGSFRGRWRWKKDCLDVVNCVYISCGPGELIAQY